MKRIILLIIGTKQSILLWLLKHVMSCAKLLIMCREKPTIDQTC